MIEAVIASAVVITIAAGVAHLLLWARRSAWSAGTAAVAVSLAVEKMEQLRALPWYVDASGAPVSDTTTNLAAEPASSGGTGLQPSPAGALDRSTDGFVDYLDAQGRWCGTGTRSPAEAAYVRRWAVEPFVPDGTDTVVLTVVTETLADAAAAGPANVRRVRLRTLKTRIAQ